MSVPLVSEYIPIISLIKISDFGASWFFSAKLEVKLENWLKIGNFLKNSKLPRIDICA